MKIITDERCTNYVRAGHPENPRRVAATVARLQNQTELPLVWASPSEAVVDKIILRAHEPAMLARLEAAFARQRQFTADASHELRTPLTIVNLEVNHALAAPRKPAEYQRALRVIQAENEFMSELVNDLLL